MPVDIAYNKPAGRAGTIAGKINMDAVAIDLAPLELQKSAAHKGEILIQGDLLKNGGMDFHNYRD